MAKVQRIAPCLWFDNQGEEAAKLYVSIFKNSSINAITRFGKAGFEVHKRPEGSVQTVAFTLDGQDFLALNGGPMFKFSEAVSLMVYCEDQKEIDYYWDKLGAEGDPKSQICGWLKDKFGLSWQIVPKDIVEMQTDPKRAERVMNVVLQSKKLDLAALRRAYNGEA